MRDTTGIEREIPRPKYRRVKTPTVLQMEAVECGAASLAIILGYFGKILSLEELRTACGVSRDGSNAYCLLEAAKNFGLDARGYKKDLSSLYELKPPFIVFWNFNHYLVVEGFNRDKAYLNDPAMGPRVVDFHEFDESYTGVVLTFSPEDRFEPGGSRPSVWRSIERRLHGSWPAVWFVSICGLALVLPGLALPAFARILVDDYLVAGMTDWLHPLLMGLAVTALLRGLLTWLQSYFLLRFETKLAVSNSGKFLWHILHLPVEFYSQRFAGEISHRVEFNSEIAELITNRLAVTSIDLLMIVFFGAMLLAISPFLTLIALFVVIVNIAVTRLMNRSMVDDNLRLEREYGKTTGTAMAGISNIETLKAMGAEADFFSEWSGQHAKATITMQSLGMKNVIFSRAPAMTTALADVAVLGFGALLIMQGKMTMGLFVAFQSLMSSFLQPLNSLVGLITVFQTLKAKLLRLDDVFNYRVDASLHGIDSGGDDDSSAPPPAGPARETKLTGNVVIEDISFGYSRFDDPLISNFHIHLAPGARVALVGASGCGKSTIAKLVAGLYEPWKGRIFFDGTPRSDISRSRLTDSIAMVDQEINLFSGTIRENITLWDPTVPESDVVEACKDAVIHEEITARQGGYDGRVDEAGSNFSGGQRQRLEIARALVNNPRILVLDEATSALDSVTEKELSENLRIRGCTCIIIAHRLSTIRDVDEIIVLDEGQVIQRGTHESLMRSPDLPYARLVTAS